MLSDILSGIILSVSLFYTMLSFLASFQRGLEAGDMDMFYTRLMRALTVAILSIIALKL